MSLLHGILKRLLTLQDEENNSDAKQRFFEINGEKKCSVKYFDHTKMFELEVYQPGEKPKTYQFDNIDMVAIDVFDILSSNE
ncbi:YkuJ family protein [Bacillus sp. Marseille-P3661]|uniref:YkuJ family protein n=1 Tax=Bacillus sp. Marseille-P3661 TaxID=1936234 RepID=UPI000C85BD00|nr:YkuJ family protein [Bacillus sp. Marseille-P3661]